MSINFGEGIAHLVGMTYGKNRGVLVKVDGYLTIEQFRAVAYALAEVASGRGKHADLFREEQELTIRCQPAKQEELPTEEPDHSNGIPLDELAEKTLFGKRPNSTG